MDEDTSTPIEETETPVEVEQAAQFPDDIGVNADVAVPEVADVLSSTAMEWGIACTECGNFIVDPNEERMVTKCGSCGANRTRCFRKNVKTLVNQERDKRGLSPLYD